MAEKERPEIEAPEKETPKYKGEISEYENREVAKEEALTACVAQHSECSQPRVFTIWLLSARLAIYTAKQHTHLHELTVPFAASGALFECYKRGCWGFSRCCGEEHDAFWQCYTTKRVRADQPMCVIT